MVGDIPITVTITQARALSGLGQTTLWELIRRGQLASVKVGRRRLVRRDSLEQLLSPRNLSEAPRRRGRPRKAVA
jgi:excisionase family DNA binding protein